MSSNLRSSAWGSLQHFTQNPLFISCVCDTAKVVLHFPIQGNYFTLPVHANLSAFSQHESSYILYRNGYSYLHERLQVVASLSLSLSASVQAEAAQALFVCDIPKVQAELANTFATNPRTRQRQSSSKRADFYWRFPGLIPGWDTNYPDSLRALYQALHTSSGSVTQVETGPLPFLFLPTRYSLNMLSVGTNLIQDAITASLNIPKITY
jgi:hypothetical protein